MLKSILGHLTLASFLITGAHAEISIPNALQGFGVGASASYGMGGSKVDRSYHISNFNAGQKDKSNLSGRGAFGGIHLTYNMIFQNCFFLGFEGFASWGKMKGKTENKFAQGLATHTDRLEMKESYGGAVKFGALVVNALPYVKVGGVSSKWHAHSTTTISTMSHNKSHSKHLAGLIYGLGIEVPVHRRVTIGAEFLHTDYKKMNYKLSDNKGRTITKYSITPRNNTFALHVKFKV